MSSFDPHSKYHMMENFSHGSKSKMTSLGKNEGTSLLMSVIRTLSASENYQQREIEKAKLERAFKESDAIIDKMIADYYEDFSTIIQSFSKISANMNESNISIKRIKENLLLSKGLLNCQRDDLKVLWLEGLQQKYILEMLEQIEIIKSVPNEIENKLGKKHYLALANLYVSSTSQLEGDLKQVEGLREIKAEIVAKREKIKYSLLKDLRTHLYIRTTVKGDYKAIPDGSNLYNNKQSESIDEGLYDSNRMLENQSYSFIETTKYNVRKHLKQASKKLFAVSSFDDDSMDQADAKEVEEDVDLANPEYDSAYFMAIVIQALAKLGLLKDGFDMIKDSMQSDLCSIVLMTTNEIKNRVQGRNRSGSVSSASPRRSLQTGKEGGLEESPLAVPYEEAKDDPELFKELLERLFIKFWAVARAHKYALKCFKHSQRGLAQEGNDKKDIGAVIKKGSVPKGNQATGFGPPLALAPPYDIIDVWSHVQSALQMTLCEYLAMESSSSSAETSSYPTEIENLNNYFSRKRTTTKRAQPLFRFDNSASALNSHRYLREQRKRKSLALLATSPGPDDYSPTSGGAGSEIQTLPPLLTLDYEEGGPAGPGNYFVSSALCLANNVSVMVCKPSVRNLNIVYRPVKMFCTRLEREIRIDMDRGQHCILYSFFSDYVKEIYLVEVHNSVANRIELYTKGPDAWKMLVNTEQKKSPDVDRPLLLNTFILDRCIKELKDISYDLPDYSNQFLLMICKILQNYKETCMSAYKGVVQPDTEERRVISATWAKDEDINRFLRSLPNWYAMRQHQLYYPPSPTLSPPPPDKTTGQTNETNPDNSSPTTMAGQSWGGLGGGGNTASHAKESEILTGNLGDEVAIPEYELLTEPGSIKMLAHLHESVEWLGTLRIASSLLPEMIAENEAQRDSSLGPDEPAPTSNSSGAERENTRTNETVKIPISNFIIDSLRAFAQDFEELAETCLLVIHLEIRVHCFYFLKPLASQCETMVANAMNDESKHGEISDLDPNVIKLNKDLTMFEEILSASIQKHKVKYVVDGLGHLISTLMINTAASMKKINHQIIKRMCHNIFSLQQNLTNITLCRETDLDRARLYYEMMYKSPDEIVNGIVEQGAQFSQLEYRNAVKLLHRSLNTPLSSQKIQLKRLEDALKKPVLV